MLKEKKVKEAELLLQAAYQQLGRQPWQAFESHWDFWKP